MKTRVFDKGLYREGMHQLRGIGLAATLLASLIALIQPICALCGGLSLDSELLTTYVDETGTSWIGRYLENRVASLGDMSNFWGLAVLVMAPVFVLWVFRFLNRREASDFYHAMAQSRLTLYVSFYLAALTWTAILLFVPGVLPLALLVIGTDITILWGSVFESLLFVGVLALLLSGGAALARGLTGTRFSAIALLLTILFLPRLLIDTWLVLVCEQLPMIQNVAAFDFDVLRLNLLANNALHSFFNEMFGPTNLSSSAVPEGVPYIYTAVLGVVYAALGGVAFCRRRSELSGVAAPGRVLQTVYRVGLSMLVCVPACALIAIGVKEDRQVVAVVALYALAAAVYLLYELLTTRRWKSVLRALPALGIVAVLNVAFIGGFFLYRNHVLAFSPAAEEVTAVRVMDTERLRLVKYTDFPAHAEDDYFTQKAKAIDLADEKARGIVTKALTRLVDRARTGDVQQRGTPYLVEIDVGGETVTRTVQLESQEIQSLRKCYWANEEYRRLVTALPSLSQKGVTLVSMGDMTDESTMRTVYNSLLQDLTTADVDRWIAHLADEPLVGHSTTLNGYLRPGNFEVKIEEDGQIYAIRTYVPFFFPKACSSYLFATQATEQTEVLELLKNPDQSRYTEVKFNLYNFPGHPEENRWFSVELTGERQRQLVQQVAATLSPGAVDVEKATVTVGLCVKDGDKTTDYHTTFQVDAQALLAIEGVPNVFY